jgi:hypothetical protein
MQEDFDGGAAEMTGQAGGSHASSAKKRKKSAPVPPDAVKIRALKIVQEAVGVFEVVVDLELSYEHLVTV